MQGTPNPPPTPPFPPRRRAPPAPVPAQPPTQSANTKPAKPKGAKRYKPKGKPKGKPRGRPFGKGEDPRRNLEGGPRNPPPPKSFREGMEELGPTSIEVLRAVMAKALLPNGDPREGVPAARVVVGWNEKTMLRRLGIEDGRFREKEVNLALATDEELAEIISLRERLDGILDTVANRTEARPYVGAAPQGASEEGVGDT